MRLIITGGSSYLGQHMVPLASTQHDVVYTYFSNDSLGLPIGRKLDTRDRDAVFALADDFQPDAIIHLAGSNRTPDMTAVIVGGTRHIVDAARQHNARIVHMSTDVLFDGTAGPYAESAEANPRHAYGQAKADSETIVAAAPNHAIVRTSLIYSLRIMDMGTRWMKQAIEDGNPPMLFSNHLRCPVHADDLANACIELAQNDFVGVMHVAGAQQMSRADFSRAMLTYWGVDVSGVTDGPDHSGKFPVDVRMDISLAQRVLETKLRGVSEVLGS